MRFVADQASFTRGFVFINKRAALQSVALVARFVVSHQRSAPSDNGVTLVRFVTVGATHFAFNDGMSVRQVEFAPLVQVTGKADLRRFAGVDDGVPRAAALIMNAARAVAGFAAHVEGVCAFGHQLGMRGSWEVAIDVFVTLGARMRPDKLSAGNFRWCYHRARHRCARKEHDGGNGRKSYGNSVPNQTPVGRCSNLRRVSAQ